MDAVSHFSDARSQAEALSTPQPHDATMPSNLDIPPAISPATSTAAGNPSSPPQPFGIEAFPPFRHMDRVKYSSPPPPSSMTPPPSSQARKRVVPDSPIARATTPSPSVFSSPPPTLPNGVKREASMGVARTVPTAQQIAEASPAELRELLQASVSEVIKLDTDIREARMLAAHYKLQHNLLSIETEEAAKRMEVEHEMTRREVEVLQTAEHRQTRRDIGSPLQSATSRYVAELKAYCEAMINENTLLHRRLQRAKKIIAQKDSDLNTVMEENRNYLKRIRENREHLSLLKSPGGMYAAATPRSSSTFPVTPQQYRGTPKQTPRSMRQENDSQDSFAATLLLADRVLNQENNSAPTTPTTSRPAQRSHIRHHRGVQSMSSLPSTPARSRPMTDNGNLLPSVQFAPQSEPRYRTQQEFFSQPRERSRKSRDSTISAEDAEEIAAYHESGDEEIPESQASQTATEMLRLDPRESMEVVGSPAPPTVAAEASGLLQAKIFGSVTKSGVEKRKRVDDLIEIEAKKMRTGEGSIGLGIARWA